MKIDKFDIKIFNSVYPPSEDTYLLYDNIETKASKAVEACCGTGIITLKIADKGAYVISTDINLQACLNTVANAKANNLFDKIDVICTDLLLALRKGAKIDLIACNPPYLPCEPKDLEDLAVCGGKEGYETALRLIHMYHELFQGKCTLYLVVSSRTNLNKILAELKKLKLNIRIIAKKDLQFFETLYLLRIQS
ncbi:MAG: hypothetical protein DRJ52_06085 [Thermoprotei archaeon]|nr:MAG: hypothetical protein DRJ52_06085 [Thermoprotei archaeon]RLF00659.1 MAG: hypothetical protein DRJ63_01845 [Thermoprotei archaeon]HDI75081.1 methyltransferase domain-containing protein [Thermoprotei archaeon]